MVGQVLENFGRPTNILRPVDLDHIYREKRVDLPIILHVTLASTGIARDNHWTIAWQVGMADKYKVHRRVQIVREILATHLTNWGAMTKASTADTQANAFEMSLGVLGYEARRRLEEIGDGMEVYEPDGQWNCQNWVVMVLRKAEEEGLIEKNVWMKAVMEAEGLGKSSGTSVLAS